MFCPGGAASVGRSCWKLGPAVGRYWASGHIVAPGSDWDPGVSVLSDNTTGKTQVEGGGSPPLPIQFQHFQVVGLWGVLSPFWPPFSSSLRIMTANSPGASAARYREELSNQAPCECLWNPNGRCYPHRLPPLKDSNTLGVVQFPNMKIPILNW